MKYYNYRSIIMLEIDRLLLDNFETVMMTVIDLVLLLIFLVTLLVESADHTHFLTFIITDRNIATMLRIDDFVFLLIAASETLVKDTDHTSFALLTTGGTGGTA